MNGDGGLDIIVDNYEQQNVFYLNNGAAPGPRLCHARGDQRRCPYLRLDCADARMGALCVPRRQARRVHADLRALA